MNIEQVRNMTFMNKIRFLFYGLDYVEYKIEKADIARDEDARRIEAQKQAERDLVWDMADIIIDHFIRRKR